MAKVASGPASVISCGGGIVLRQSNREILASTGIRIYLRSDPATLARRLHSSSDRPLLPADSREASLAQQLTQRAGLYEESEIQIDVSLPSPEKIVTSIRNRLPVPWSR